MDERTNDTGKKRTTIYISPEVLEFLAIRRAKGAGSVSQQLEDLARRLMPKQHSERDIRALEQKHAEGYARKPVQEGEFDVWEDEQVWGEA